ncbi:PE family protein [Skermania sp. ID1734]|uniref:PE domain-containing protein n=1 Tax=Skermania sp. ID1734 TaxID=2597516 RepID=UPI00118133F1|nr:PE domain-containing protein [Skermania sp. ID1734]TSE00783.1 PE family protein [Skermania sp. ID1734]
MPGHVLVIPEVVLAAAAELEALAERLTAAASMATPATHVLPSGSEEVSALAAGFFNRAAATHETAIAHGIAELQHAAATLRAQAAEYVAHDAVHATSLGAVGASI